MTNKSNSHAQFEAVDHTWRNLFVYLLGCGLATVLVFWPWTLGKQSALRAPTVVVHAGTIMQIHFVGGLLMNTQIDTELRPWLVEGLSKWLAGTRLETRENFYGRRICVVGTDDCRSYR